MAMSCSWFGTSLALNTRVSRCGVIGISFPKVAENFSCIMGKCWESMSHEAEKCDMISRDVYMYTFLSFRLKDSVDCLHETLSNPIWCLHVPALFKSGWCCDMRTLAYVLFAWMAKMDAARVSVCLAIFKLMWNRSLNNKVIVLSILSAIVPFLKQQFPGLEKFGKINKPWTFWKSHGNQFRNSSQYNRIVFNQVLNFGVGLHKALGVRLLNPPAFKFIMSEIPALMYSI